MNHHTWASTELILPVAMALVFAPALKAAESSTSFYLDGKAAIERVPAPPAASDRIAGEQEASGQASPRPGTISTEQPTVKAPLVSYEGGQLTINAENASLSDVMKALRQALGADIDLPAGVVDQRIWVHLGPGPASRIVRDLLDGTEFNYVIQAAEGDSDGIRSVLLTPRSKSTGAEAAGPGERAPLRKVLGIGSEAQNSPDAEKPAAEPVASADPSQASPSAAPADGSSNTARVQNVPNDLASIVARPATPTDPNEQIQTLQSMYQQRRQLQMQQNQKPSGQN